MGGGVEEKREAREKASELGRTAGRGVGGRGNEDEAKERERKREKREGGRQKELGVNRQFHVVGRT